jgi:uncharacterized protein (TIGR02246 family)
VSDEQEIRDLVATWMSATKAGDVQTVLGMMTDDVVFLVYGKPPFGKEQFAASQKPAAGKPAPVFDGHGEIQEIHVAGDVAYLRSKLEVETTLPDGKKTRRAGHTLTVLRKSRGRWQIARDANLLAPVNE